MRVRKGEGVRHPLLGQGGIGIGRSRAVGQRAGALRTAPASAQGRTLGPDRQALRRRLSVRTACGARSSGIEYSPLLMPAKSGMTSCA